MASRLRLAVFDLAGTVCDHGVFAPTTAFIQTFARVGVKLLPNDVRRFMGLHKREHLRSLLTLPSVREAWTVTHGSPPNRCIEAQLYDIFVPLQLEILERESTAISGASQAILSARELGLKIGCTTGYIKSMANIVTRKLLPQGIKFDSAVASDEVEKGRPAPYMIQKNQELVQVDDPSAVVKIGDTSEDILEGKEAGVWTVAVIASSNSVALREDEFQALSAEQRIVLLAKAREQLGSTYPDFMIDSIGELPLVITRINWLLANGVRP